MTLGWSIGNGTIVTEDGLVEDGLVVVRGSKISYAGARRKGPSPWCDAKPDVDAAGGYICPGFIDVHVHGGGGADVMDGQPSALETMARSHARHGTTGMLATTMTAPMSELLQAVRAIARVQSTGGARILGLHLEGPYVNKQRAGAQNPAHMRPPSLAELAQLYDEANGRWRRITLAPELPGASLAISWLMERGIDVSLGHTMATFEQARSVFAGGVRSVTHTFNAMNSLHHREPGLLGAAFLDDSVWMELIADGIHVHPGAMALLYRVKGPEKILLVTDSMRAQGCGDGQFTLGDLDVTVRDGEARLLSDDPAVPGALAGSVLTMDAAVRTMVQQVGATVEEAVRMASANPAAALGMQESKGALAKGKDADIVVLDASLYVQRTVVEGRIVYEG